MESVSDPVIPASESKRNSSPDPENPEAVRRTGHHGGDREATGKKEDDQCSGPKPKNLLGEDDEVVSVALLEEVLQTVFFNHAAVLAFVRRFENRESCRWCYLKSGSEASTGICEFQFRRVSSRRVTISGCFFARLLDSDGSAGRS